MASKEKSKLAVEDDSMHQPGGSLSPIFVCDYTIVIRFLVDSGA